MKESISAGEPIKTKLTRAPGNNAPIGGLKVVTAPAGLLPGRQARRTSTKSTRRASRARHILHAIVNEAQAMVNNALPESPRQTDAGIREVIPPFPPDYRASGILLHVTSLPSAYGIGDLGPSAFAWIDRLHDAGQGWWQALPLGPTGYGNSPYQSLSSFAGNDLLISPEYLIADGLLRTERL